MSVLVRFNSVIARKDSIAAGFDGGLTVLRQVLSEGRALLAEDDELLLEHSMSMTTLDERLAAAGLDRRRDFCYATETDDWTPDVPWLRTERVGGLPVCWLDGTDPGFISDAKPARAVRRWSKQACQLCGATIGLGPCHRAIAAKEQADGPLAWVSVGMAETGPWTVLCEHCGAAHLGSEAGKLDLKG